MTGKIQSKKGNSENWMDGLMRRNPLQGPWNFPWYRRLDDRYSNSMGGALGMWLHNLTSRNETKHLERTVAIGWEAPREGKEKLVVVPSLDTEINENALVLLTKSNNFKRSSSLLPGKLVSEPEVFVLPNLCETKACGKRLIEYLRKTRAVEQVQVNDTSELV